MNVPEKYVWQKKSKMLTEQRESESIKSEVFGTLPLLPPNMGDAFYLKLLLTHNHCKDKMSESYLRTVDGTTYNTCKDKCMKLGVSGYNRE